MANLGFQFNAADFKPFEDFSLLPKGEWNVIISKSEIDQSKADKPKLVLTFSIMEGSEKGKELHENLFLWMPSDGSKGGGSGEISRRKMTTIINAIGIQNFEDTAILHNRPFTITTDIKYTLKNDNSGNYIGFPEIKTFKKFVGQGQAAGADPIQPMMPGAAAQVASTAPSLPSATNFAVPAAPAPVSFAPAQVAPQGFAIPAQPAFPQAAPVGFAPPMVPTGFAPPVAPTGFQPAAPGAPGPWGAPR